jgi:hypothetical protein
MITGGGSSQRFWVAVCWKQLTENEVGTDEKEKSHHSRNTIDFSNIGETD